MISKSLHKTKRFFQKQGIKLKKLSDPVRNFKTEHERECIAICKRLIPLKDTLLLFTPLSNKKYIRNDELDIFVIIQGRHVQIINHVYSYSITIEGRGLEEVINFFNTELEKRRLEFETEITSNIKHSLKTILRNIN
jgi:hypothetical protein